MALAVATLLSSPPASGVAGFGDIASPRFYTVAVQWMVDNDITFGTSPTCFSPYDPVTRGQAAAFMWRMEGEPAPLTAHGFDDVVWAYQQDAVSWMVENNITFGTTPTTFESERALTRGELAVLLWRLAGKPAGAPPHPFVDVFAPWQQDAVSWLVANSITFGITPTTFAPNNIVSRAEIATFLWRYKGAPAVTVDPTHPTSPPCAGQVAALPTTTTSTTSTTTSTTSTTTSTTTTTTTTTTTMKPMPMLVPEGTILTRPFAGSSTRMFDAEGMAYVPVDDTLWLADDNSNAIFEIDAASGTLLQTIGSDVLAAAPQFGGGPLAGTDRTGDLESLAYDPVSDHLYVYNGTCCTPDASATAFRLTRADGTFEVDTYQPLTDSFSAAAGSETGEIYVAINDPGPDDLHSYDYATNTVGAGFSIPGVTGAIWGMGFSDDGADLYIGNAVSTLFRVDWATKTIVTDHVFSLTTWLDGPSSVEPIDGRLYILDGDDTLDASDPLKYAIHIFSISTG